MSYQQRIVRLAEADVIELGGRAARGLAAENTGPLISRLVAVRDRRGAALLFALTTRRAGR